MKLSSLRLHRSRWVLIYPDISGTRSTEKKKVLDPACQPPPELTELSESFPPKSDARKMCQSLIKTTLPAAKIKEFSKISGQSQATIQKWSNKCGLSLALAREVSDELNYRMLLSYKEEGNVDSVFGKTEQNQTTIETAIARFLDSRDAPGTKTQYTTTLGAFRRQVEEWGKTTIEDVRRIDVVQFLSTLVLAAPQTKNNYISNIRTFFEWLVDSELLDKSPVRNIKKQKAYGRQFVRLSKSEIDSICEAAETIYTGLGDIFRFMAATGIRRGELCAIRCAWVVRQGARTYLQIQKQTDTVSQYTFRPKTPKSARRIPLNPVARGIAEKATEATDIRLEKFRLAGDMVRYNVWKRRFLFASARGHPMRAGKLSPLFKRAVKLSDITPDPTLHDLRHNFAMEFLSNTNNDINALSRVLGHESVVMSLKYADHVDLEKTAGVMDQIWK